MEMILLISFGTGLVFTTLIFGFMCCKRKLTDEELQQKYFKKFSKRHIVKTSYLSNGVDYVRSVAKMKQMSQKNKGSCHTGDEILSQESPQPPDVHVEGTSSPPKSDYSFFDDSFQTVIEVSSSNMSSNNNGDSNHLVVSKDQHASYLSLHNSESQPCLRSGSSAHQATSQSAGEVNAAFSDRSGSLACNTDSTCSLFDSYLVPDTGPKIHVIQPSVKKRMVTEIPALNMETIETNKLQLNVKMLERNSRARREQNNKLISHSTECYHNGNDIKGSDNIDGNELSVFDKIENVKERRLQKVSIEGQIHSKEMPPFRNTTYEKLQTSKTEQYIYKSLNKTSLVLPGRPKMCSPIVTPAMSRSEQFTPKRPKSKQTTGSEYSEHTYESITSELSHGINRSDSVASDDNDYDSAYNNLNNGHGNVLRTPAHRGSYTDGQNNLNASSPEHTYESVNTPFSIDRKKNKTCENSAVIIGHRVSFDKTWFPDRIKNKFQQKRQEETSNQAAKMLSVTDSADRYSPFPVTKKLAFKPAFKQVASPRFSMIQTMTENVTSQLEYPPKMFLDDLNIKTPEIKVDNCSQFFDDTAFIPQDVLNANSIKKNGKCIDTVGFLHPPCKYNNYQSVESDIQSKVSWSNLKISHVEKNMYCKRSLPSLSDHLEEEMELYFNANMYTRSTPCDLHAENCNFF